MTYEARHHKRINFALAGASLALSLLGFMAAGIIPVEGGDRPAIGWAIVAACFLAAFVFVRRAFDQSPQARLDERGIYARRLGPDPVAWDDIVGAHVIAAGIQRIARFERRDGRKFGINTTFYDRGIKDLRDAARRYRPDLGL